MKASSCAGQEQAAPFFPTNSLGSALPFVSTEKQPEEHALINHANVLGLSLRLLSTEKLQEILDQWFSTPFSTDAWNLSQIKALETIEKGSE